MSHSVSRHTVPGWVLLGVLTALAGGCGGAEPTTPNADFGKGRPGPSGAVTVSDVLPGIAPRDTTLDLVVLGSGFDDGSVASFERGGAPAVNLRVNATTFRSSEELLANVTIDADAALASYDAAVTTRGGKKGIATEQLEIVDAGIDLLGSLAASSMVWGMSDAGHVVGNYSLADGRWAPFRWYNEQALAIPLEAGWTGAYAVDVSEGGTVIGVAEVPGRALAVQWTESGGAWSATLLPFPDGYGGSAAAINRSGDIGGKVRELLSATNFPVIWRNGAPYTLPAVIGGVTHLFDLNDSGWAAGIVHMPDGSSRGYVWIPDGTIDQVQQTMGGRMILLPVAGTVHLVEEMNNSGSVVGAAKAGRRGTWSGVRWRLAVPGTIPQQSSDFVAELLPGTGFSVASNGIEEAGTVVGYFREKTGDPYRVARWAAYPGNARTLIGPSNSQGDKINASGWIGGRSNGRATLWKPEAP